MPLRLSRPSQACLDALLAGSRSATLTYPAVGATAGQPPSGYVHDRRSTPLGGGPAVWEAAKVALAGWQAHESGGVHVTPAGAAVEAGTDVVVVTRLGPLWMATPCRVVYTTNTAERFGFAYGTLPGHPEEGEEAFHVCRDGAGRVSFEIVVFSRPAALLARLGGPVTAAVQQRATGRYLAALRSALGS